jgi:hypothetical protein
VLDVYRLIVYNAGMSTEFPGMGEFERPRRAESICGTEGYITSNRKAHATTLAKTFLSGNLTFGGADKDNDQLMRWLIDLSVHHGSLLVGPGTYHGKGITTFQSSLELQSKPSGAYQKLTVEAEGFKYPSDMPVGEDEPLGIPGFAMALPWPRLDIVFSRYEDDGRYDAVETHHFSLGRNGTTHFLRIPRLGSSTRFNSGQAAAFLLENLPTAAGPNARRVNTTNFTFLADRLRQGLRYDNRELPLVEPFLHEHEQSGFGMRLFVPEDYLATYAKGEQLFSLSYPAQYIPDDNLSFRDPQKRLEDIAAHLGNSSSSVNPELLFLKEVPGTMARVVTLEEEESFQLLLPRTMRVPTVIFDKAAEVMLRERKLTSTAFLAYLKMFEKIKGGDYRSYSQFMDSTPSGNPLIRYPITARFSHDGETAAKEEIEVLLGMGTKSGVDIKSDYIRGLIDEYFEAAARLGEKLMEEGAMGIGLK